MEQKKKGVVTAQLILPMQIVGFLVQRVIYLLTLGGMSRPMEKPTICSCENKDADQLRGNREADQRLCFRYMDSTIPVLLKYKISSLQTSSGTVQPGLCQTCSENTLLVFPRGDSYIKISCFINLTEYLQKCDKYVRPTVEIFLFPLTRPCF